VLQSEAKAQKKKPSVGILRSHEGCRRDGFILGELRKVGSELFCSHFSPLSASSTPAVNIQPDVSAGWDWHTKPGKGQQVIFCKHLSNH
jgi:hypothetical protein